jgi:hypothetical protein
MTEPRDVLLGWLEAAAARTRQQRLLQDSAWAGSGLLVLAAFYLLLARFVQPPEVVAALLPLIIFAGSALPVAVIARRWQRPGLAEVAAATDARAGLQDALLSAHCFSDGGNADAYRELHLQRAAGVTQTLDLRRVFPLETPGSAGAVAAAALLSIAAMLGLPRSAAPLEPVPQTVRAGTSNGINADLAPGSAADAEEAGKLRTSASLWMQLDAIAASLPGTQAGQSLTEAIAARDARAAAQAAEALKKSASASSAAPPAREAPDEQMSAALAQGILERLSELLKAGEADAVARAPQSESEQATARLDRELRAEQPDAQQSATRQQSAGEDAVNTLLRALSRSSTGGRDRVHGEADSMDGAGRASMGGGAMGRRVSTSSAGAGEGDQPGTTVTPAIEGDSVLGTKTQRLEVQLRAVKMPDSNPDEQAESDRKGTEEATYAATRAQAARTALQTVPAASFSASEAELDEQRSPLEFREAVKRYSLARHRRDAEQRVRSMQ